MKAITGRAPAPAQRRRRTDETKRGFRLAVAVTHRAIRSFFHHPAQVFYIHEQRAEAERVLRAQLEEWANDDHAEEQDGFFTTRPTPALTRNRNRDNSSFHE